MYDQAMTPANIEVALRKYIHNRSMQLLRFAPKPLVEALGGIERLVQPTIRDAAKAAEALAVPPRLRLSQMVDYWLHAMDRPDAADWKDGDIQVAAEMDEMDEILRVRLVEIRDALLADDVDAAFQFLRNIHKEREGEKHPAMVAVPDSLDPSSAYWLDLDLNLDN
jgi:hypothetical protein